MAEAGPTADNVYQILSLVNGRVNTQPAGSANTHTQTHTHT